MGDFSCRTDLARPPIHQLKVDRPLALFRQSLGAKVVREDHLMEGSHKCACRIAKIPKSNKP